MESCGGSLPAVAKETRVRLAAGMYGGSEGLGTFVAEAWAPGGQAGTSTRIEKLPRLSEWDFGDRPDPQSDPAARRFDAVLSSFHRAVELARSVRIVVRGKALKSTMSHYLVDRIERSPQIES
jgi:thioredoxin reductase